MTARLKISVISSPNPKEDEAALITDLLESGLERFHLRKPKCKAQKLASILNEIPHELHPKIVIHRNHELLKDYNLGGYHHRAEEKLKPCPKGTRSRSLHKVHELLVENEVLDYVFIGPVFSSVSKAGYKAKMSLSSLSAALEKLDSQAKRPLVYALGGIRKNKLPAILETGFDGVALLGSIWGKPDPVRAFREFKTAVSNVSKTYPRW